MGLVTEGGSWRCAPFSYLYSTCVEEIPQADWMSTNIYFHFLMEKMENGGKSGGLNRLYIVSRQREHREDEQLILSRWAPAVIPAGIILGCLGADPCPSPLLI